MEERDYCIALNMVEGLGSLRLAELYRAFGSAAGIVAAGEAGWREHGVKEDAVRRRISVCVSAPEVTEELRQIEAHAVAVLTRQDEAYPELLRQIYDPPIVLYVRGSVESLADPGVGIVGCRRASWYGLQQAGRLARGLAQRNVTVISGLARGIDTAAHKGCLDGEGTTLAVLGSGLAHVYPPENSTLAEQIARQGAVMSEFPLTTRPWAGNFPRRNRIISGLSLAVVVVEAAARSGSLITARLALEQGRDVFAVPGQAGAITAHGTNQLIKDGAMLVETADDIVQELGFGSGQGVPAQTKPVDARVVNDETGQRLLALLSSSPVYIDDLILASAQPAPVVYQRLVELQLAGLVREVDGKRFVRT